MRWYGDLFTSHVQNFVWKRLERAAGKKRSVLRCTCKSCRQTAVLSDRCHDIAHTRIVLWFIVLATPTFCISRVHEHAHTFVPREFACNKIKELADVDPSISGDRSARRTRLRFSGKSESLTDTRGKSPGHVDVIEVARLSR